MEHKIEYRWKTYLKDSWILLKRRKIKFLFYTFMITLASLIPFLLAYLLGAIIDFFIGYNTGDPLTNFYYFVGTIAIAGGFQVWLRFFGKNGLMTIAANIRREIRVAAISKIMDFELKQNEKEETGSKIHKINEGGQSIYDGISLFSNEGISIVSGLVGSIVIFVALDIWYVLFAIAYLVIYLSGETYFNKRITFWEEKLSKIREKVSGKMHESASNILTVKALGLKETFEKSTQSYENKFYKIWNKRKNISQMKFKVVKIFAALGYGVFLLIVGFDVIAGAITIASIFVYGAYFMRLKNSLESITNRSTHFIKIKSSVGRFMTLFNIKTFDRETNLLEIPKKWEKVQFVNVTFKYKNKNVLENFNLTINRNDRIGVVGESGCGKSTLAKIFLGLYKPQKGNILIDGVNIKKYKHSSLINNIGVVLQESEIFNYSLLENVTISSIDNNFKTFDKAIKIAELGDVIKRLPKGINTLLGEKGYHLSGGERQRISIARAIYKDTPFLILDEATSALDSKTELKIQNNIDTKLDNKTLLIIAHRLSTLKKVDKIIVMDKGKIVEQGSYLELLRRGKKFYELWKTQKLK